MKALLVLLCTASAAFAQTAAQVNDALRRLPDPVPERQAEALQVLATSLDPRIPAACLPLLKSPGSSVVRNAARAIGSRWHQIPPDQTATYLTALKANLRDADSAVVNMTRRALGLLDRSYRGDMFARSKSRRWVIYERHGQPCLIDTKTQTEELLPARGTFAPAYGNEPLTGAFAWHAKRDAVALGIIVSRHVTEVVVWQHTSPLRTLSFEAIRPLLKPARGATIREGFTDIDFTAWSGDDILLTVGYSTEQGENFVDHTARVRWESTTDKFILVSDKIAP
jgi:hypothetical protein